MATIDQILDRVIRHRMEALYLDPEELPRLQRDGKCFRGARSPLSAVTIRRQVAEVAPPAADLDDGSWSFDHGYENHVFRSRPREGKPGALVVEPEGAPPRPAARRQIHDIESLLLEMLERGGSDLHLSSGHVDLEIVDVFDEQDRALADDVLVTPTLIRLSPPPRRRIVGGLDNLRDVAELLGLARRARSRESA